MGLGAWVVVTTVITGGGPDASCAAAPAAHSMIPRTGRCDLDMGPPFLVLTSTGRAGHGPGPGAAGVRQACEGGIVAREAALVNARDREAVRRRSAAESGLESPSPIPRYRKIGSLGVFQPNTQSSPGQGGQLFAP